MRINRAIVAMPLVGTILFCLSAPARGEKDNGGLPGHFQQLTPKLYSGATPASVGHFKALHAKGIRTVLSVDGAKPGVKEAHEAGMKYVHLPIGYSGIKPRIQASLAKLVKETDTPIYIHCHHGLHRGPSVAALTAIISGAYSREQALAYMKKAGTGKHYKGLWKAVRTFKGIPADVEALPLLEISPVDDLTAAMVKIDSTYDHIKLLARKPGHGDDEFSHQCLLLAEHFRESARHLTKDQSGMKQDFKEAEKIALLLRVALGKKQYGTIPAHIKSLRSSCVDCHEDHRN